MKPEFPATLPRYLHTAVLRLCDQPSPPRGGWSSWLRVALWWRPLTLPLFDRLPRWESRPRRPIANSIPRISVPGIITRFPIVPRRLPGDPVDATRLGRRFAALASALDDLPRQAKRFARWRARRDAIRAQERSRDTAAQSGHLPHVRPPDASELAAAPRPPARLAQAPHP